MSDPKYSLVEEQLSVPLHRYTAAGPSTSTRRGMPVGGTGHFVDMVDLFAASPALSEAVPDGIGSPSEGSGTSYLSDGSGEGSVSRDIFDLIGELELPESLMGMPSLSPAAAFGATTPAAAALFSAGDESSCQARCVSESAILHPTFSHSMAPMRRQTSDPSGLSPSHTPGLSPTDGNMLASTSAGANHPRLGSALQQQRQVSDKRRYNKRTAVFCQTPHCGADISNAKAYCRRYRVCVECISASSMVVNGIEQRYCQQCGHLHPIGDFDGTRRSCRAKLERHAENVRRKRKKIAEGKKIAKQ